MKLDVSGSIKGASLNASGTLAVTGASTLNGGATIGSAGTSVTKMKHGVINLSNGTATVSESVTANTRIFLTVNGGDLTHVGSTYISARTSGTSGNFTIKSTDTQDASSVAWMLVEP